MKCMGRDFYVSCKFVVKTLPLRVTDTDSVKKEIQYILLTKGLVCWGFLLVWFFVFLFA